MLGWLRKKTDDRRLVGVGLTDAGISMAVVERGDDGCVVLQRYAYAQSNSIEQTQTILEHWVKEFNLRNAPVNFVLGAHMFSCILTEAPQVKPEELAAAMRWKVKDLIQFDVTDAVVDAFAIPDQKGRGKAPMAYVVCAAIDVLRAYITVLERVGLQIQSIDIPQLVQRNVVQLIPEDKYGVAMLVLGQSRGMITLCREGNLYLSRDIEVGWSHFTDTTSPDANDGGLTLDAALPGNQRGFDTIVLEIQRSLDYFESHFGQAPIQSLVIAPLPRAIPGMIDYIASNISVQVRELDLNIILDPTHKMERQLQAMCLPAIGAALRWPIAA